MLTKSKMPTLEEMEGFRMIARRNDFAYSFGGTLTAAPGWRNLFKTGGPEEYVTQDDYRSKTAAKSCFNSFHGGCSFRVRCGASRSGADGAGRSGEGLAACIAGIGGILLEEARSPACLACGGTHDGHDDRGPWALDLQLWRYGAGEQDGLGAQEHSVDSLRKIRSEQHDRPEQDRGATGPCGAGPAVSAE